MCEGCVGMGGDGSGCKGVVAVTEGCARVRGVEERACESGQGVSVREGSG